MINKFKGEIVDMPAKVSNIMYQILDMETEIDKGKEHLWVIGLSNSNRIEYIELAGLGTIDRIAVDNRTIFRFAIMKNVASIILIHNHTSGDLIPSAEDFELTKRAILCGKEIAGISVLDHIIIGRNENDMYYSISENDRNTIVF